MDFVWWNYLHLRSFLVWNQGYFNLGVHLYLAWCKYRRYRTYWIIRGQYESLWSRNLCIHKVFFQRTALISCRTNTLLPIWWLLCMGWNRLQCFAVIWWSSCFMGECRIYLSRGSIFWMRRMDSFFSRFTVNFLVSRHF